MPSRKPAARSAPKAAKPKADAVRLTVTPDVIMVGPELADVAAEILAEFANEPATLVRLTLDNPPPEFAGMRRSQQKPLIAKANALIESGLTAVDAIAAVLSN